MKLKFTVRKEICVFLFIFLLFSFFVHWGGWYENSHFALIRAIVDEGRFEIDSYANQTTDRAFFNEHYYSDKAPFLAFLSSSVYATWKFIYNFFPTQFKEKYAGSTKYIVTYSNEFIQLIEPINPGFFVLLSKVLITIFISPLFGTLTALLLYKISKYFTNKGLLFAVIGGLGSLIFPHSLALNTLVIGTFFALFAFLFIFKTKHEKLRDPIYFFLAGMLLSFSFISDYFCSILVVFLFVYFLFNYHQKNKLFFFASGIVIGILPLLFYNYLILGNPFEFLQKYMDRKVFTTVPEPVFNSYGFLTPNVGIIYQLLFGSYRGLFFYYPVLMFSFIGLYDMWKKFKIESLTILLIFISYLIFNSARITWWGGYTFGPRYLYYATPFLIISFLFTYKYFKNKIVKIFTIAFLGFSIFSNILSLQIMEDFILDKKTLLISEEYQKKINSFQELSNPLYEHYLPLFLKHGPRSLILENLLDGHIDIDIRDKPLARDWKFPFHRH